MRILELPEVTVAAQRLSGSWEEVRIERRQAELLNVLGASGWRPIGAPTSLFYDPLWTILLLRRNEVVVPVARAKESS